MLLKQWEGAETFFFPLDIWSAHCGRSGRLLVSYTPLKWGCSGKLQYPQTKVVEQIYRGVLVLRGTPDQLNKHSQILGPRGKCSLKIFRSCTLFTSYPWLIFSRTDYRLQP